MSSTRTFLLQRGVNFLKTMLGERMGQETSFHQALNHNQTVASTGKQNPCILLLLV